MPPVGFELTISAGERPQSYALDRSATGTGKFLYIATVKYRTNLLLLEIRDYLVWITEGQLNVRASELRQKNRTETGMSVRLSEYSRD